MQRIVLTIDGMSCGHCLNAVRSALGREPGVQVESVSMGRATVAFDPAVSSTEKISAAIKNVGYRVEAVPA